MNRLISALMQLVRRRNIESDLDEELRSHLEMQADQNCDAGMSEEEARRQAMLYLGGLEQTKQICREERASYLLESLLEDVRYATRSLVREPVCALLWPVRWSVLRRASR